MMITHLLRTFLLFLLVVMAGSVHPPVHQAPAETLTGPFEVARVVDGDTITLGDGRHIRYLGINAPERGDPGAEEATRRNEDLVCGKRVMLQWDGTRHDRYRRLLAYVHADGTMVNEALLKAGAVHLFVLQPLVHYHRFCRVQEQARHARRGIWAMDQWNGPLKITRLCADAEGDDRGNLNGEYVRICNISSSDVGLRGFSINDMHGHRYVFPRAMLPPGHTALLFTGSGTDVTGGTTQLRFFWNSPRPIWSNRHETAYLRNPKGLLIDRRAYSGGRR